jgi:uncharacterized membrane protein
MIIDIIQAVAGLILVIYLPGYLLSHLLFSMLRPLERFCISTSLSIAIVTLLGFFLTIISNLFGIRAISQFGVWFSLATVCVIELIFLLRRAATANQARAVSGRRRR